jgi:RNA polymerase sigma-B factor
MTTLANESLKFETLHLFQEYRLSGNTKLRNQIMELNVGLVRRESHHWVGQCLESYEDLVQVGCLGLLRAIERFNVEKGSAFSSFAIPYIRGEIQHYLRDKGYCVRIPRRWLELGQQAAVETKNFQARFNRQPTESEIAQVLEISLTELREIKLALQNREPISLDLKVDQDGDSLTNLGDCLADADYHSFQLSQEDQIRLQQAMGQLEDRTRNVLEFVFLHDLTQRETADQLGISVITVSRRLKKGLEVLQKSLMSEVF